MRISDWSSDVCSSDLRFLRHHEQTDIFVGLEANDQLVGLQGAAALGEHRMRHRLELDEDFGLPRGQALAGAQVEGHALPAPIVDMRLHRDEGLGRSEEHKSALQSLMRISYAVFC